MARDPRSRHELQRRLEEALGPEAAETLMEALPPHPWDELATKSDLGILKSDVAGLRTDLVALEERVDRKLERLEERFELKLESIGHQLVGAFRGELNAAVTSQARMMWYSSLGAIISTGSLVLAAARL